MVHLGMLFWSTDQGRDAAARCARDVHRTVAADDERRSSPALSAPPAPFVPEELHFAPGSRVVVVGFGDRRGARAMRRAVRGALAPTFELVTPMPYTALQQMLDERLRLGHPGLREGRSTSTS